MEFKFLNISSGKKYCLKEQKTKFELVSKLVHEIFRHKNSTKYFNSLSNLLILTLTSFNKDYPIDIFSEKPEKSIIEDNFDLKRILRKELANKIKDLHPTPPKQNLLANSFKSLDNSDKIEKVKPFSKFEKFQ